MKRLFFLLTVILMASGIVRAADDKGIEFAETTYDFGTVKADHGKVVHEYVSTNKTDVPLTVVSASASCGCTKPKYTHEPVRPGENGKIVVTFRPKGQKGYVSKNIKVRYKLSGQKVRSVTLKITGNVTPR